MSMDDETDFTGLLDAEVRHRAAPDSFSIPRSDVRAALEPGDVVKLLFGFGGGEDPPAERMWVTVTAVDGTGYVGRLENQPQAITDLAVGARVEFGVEHIAAIHDAAGQSPGPEASAIVSTRIWNGSSRPVRAVRGDPSDPASSGWQLYAAEDEDDMPADLSGFVTVTHAELLDRYRSFDSIEAEPLGTRWRWDHDACEWRAQGQDRARQQVD